MNAFKEGFKKEVIKPGFKRRTVENFVEERSQGPLQKKYEWFKRRYVKLD
jgi:hypothetical protein